MAKAKQKGILKPARRALRVAEPAPTPRPALVDVLAPAKTLAMDEAAYQGRLAASLGLAQDSAGAVAGPYLPPGLATFYGAGLASMSGFIGYPRCAELMQDGLMRRGVTVTADEMIRNFPHFTGTAGPESSKAAQQLNDEMERLGVVDRFHEMAVMCGAFGGGLLFLKRRGEDIGNLAGAISVAPEFFRDGGLEALVAVEPFSVGPLSYNSTQPLSGDYFRPSAWYVAGTGEVHASRFLQFTTGELPVILRPAYNFFGVPSVQLALDYLLHFTEDRESAGRLLKKFSLTIFKTNADELLYGDDESQVARRIRVLAQQRDNDGVFAISQEDEEMVQINTPLSGVTDIVRQALEMLAVVWGIPVVKFLGVSPSGMNATGESDMRSFYDHVESQRQKIFARNFDLLARAMQFSLFNGLRDDVTWTWPSLWEMTERERAEISKMESETAKNYLDLGVLGLEEVRAALSSDEEGRYAGIDPEAVPEAGGMGEAGMAGAPPDAAQDAPEWRATENGKHFEIDTESGEITKGNVGQKSGPAAGRSAAIEEKIASIRIEPGKDSVLPSLNAETLQELGKPDKPVLLKKEVLERNASRHADVPLSEAQTLIGEALYNPVKVLRGNDTKDYMNFIGVDKARHCVVLLDVEDAKDNFEVVHWHRINMKGVKKLERKAQKVRGDSGMEGQA